MGKMKLNKRVIIVIIICMVFLGGHYLGLGRFTERYAVLAFSPAAKFLGFVSDSLSDWLSLYMVKNDFKSRNDELRKKIIELAKKNVELKILEEENDILKKKMNFLDDYEYKYVVARVLGGSFDYKSSDILINKGAQDGLKEGLAVITADGVIIGKIVDVRTVLSYVRPLSSNASNLAVIVAGKGSSLGLAHGEHNMSIKIDMLSKEAEIEIGNSVGTSGLERYIPQGLLVGEVVKVDNQDEKLWQEALIRPAVNYDEIRLVTVILSE
ncbi:MAG: rod shape-determining protein MreC [Candidatus Kuenenbacteria bacterium]